MSSRFARAFHTLGFSPAFTMIELLVVISILAALLLLTLINGPRYVAKAHDARRKSDLEAYKIMFEHHYEDHGCYPAASDLTGCGAPPDSIKPYMAKMLCDPSTRQPYVFNISGCSSYKIYTKLENWDDSDIARVGCSLNCGPDGDEQYNYGISSSNARVGDPVAPPIGGGGGGSGSQNPAGQSLGNGTYNPMGCSKQADGSWDCACTIGASCGLGCPGNTVCSPDGTYCYTNEAQCPIGH